MKEKLNLRCVFMAFAMICLVSMAFFSINTNIYALNQENTVEEVTTNEVTPQKEDFVFSGTTLTKIKPEYIATLSAEQKQNIRIVIPETTTHIADSAFQQSKYDKCRFIFLDMSKATTLKKVGNYSFFGCTNMEGSIVLATDFEAIGSSAFSGCSSLSGDLNLPDSLTTLNGHAFNGCSSLKGSLKISEGLTAIPDYAFAYCGFTGKLDIPSSIKTIGGSAFRQTSAYEGFTGMLKIPDSVTSIGATVFAYQAGFTSLQLSSSMTVIPSSAFKGIGVRGSFTIPSSIQTMDSSAFAEAQLQTVRLPKRVDSSNTTFIKNTSFTDCNNLTAIICDKEDYDYVYATLNSSSKSKLGYPITVHFDVTSGIEYPAIHGLYNKQYNFQCDENDVWKTDASYQFPKVEGKAWGLSNTAVQELLVSDKVIQDTLYLIDKLENPIVTFSDGIDKVYDGLPASLTVSATHPLAQKYENAKAGDVIFRYTWSWLTIGSSDPVLTGFDKNVYDVTDVRVPNYSIACRVSVQAYIVTVENKARLFNTVTHDFGVNLRPAPPVVNPIYPKDKILLADGMPEITTSTGDTKGSISWDPNQELQEGIKEYMWTFIPEKNIENSSNYTMIKGTATLQAAQKITYSITSSCENGRIEMESSNIDKGQDVNIKFRPNAGYRIKKVVLDNQDITDEIVNDSYTIKNIQADHTITVNCVLLPLDEIRDKINSIPDISGGVITDEQEKAILDIAKYFTELSDDIQREISAESITKIYESLYELPQISIECKNTSMELPDAKTLLETMSADDLTSLLENPTAKYSIEIILKEQTPTEDERNLINKALDGAMLSDTLSIKVVKHLTVGDSTDTSIVSMLRNPVKIMLHVPTGLPALEDGYDREMMIIRLHENGTTTEATLLHDEDNNDDSITIHTDRFSMYAIAYKDSKKNSTENYTITPTAGANGTISPTKAVLVKQGENQAFRFTPDKGYKIYAVYIDGKNMGTIPSYEFQNVRKNHTIKVLFVKDKTIANSEKDDKDNKPAIKTGDTSFANLWGVALLTSLAILFMLFKMNKNINYKTNK